MLIVNESVYYLIPVLINFYSKKMMVMKKLLHVLALGVFVLCFGNVYAQPGGYAFRLESNNNFGDATVLTNNVPVTGVLSGTVTAASTADQYLIEWDGFANKWTNTTHPKNTVTTLTWGGGNFNGPDGVLTGDFVSGKRYTLQIRGLDYSNRQGIIMETDNAPISFSAVSNPVQVCTGSDAQINITLTGNKSAQERVFVRYSSTAAFTTSKVVEATGTGSTWSTATALIPGADNTSGAIFYYAYTTTVASTNATDHDLVTLRFGNNGGSNYSYTINALPSVTPGSNPTINRGVTTANLAYSNATNSPNQYSITWNAAAITAGFSNVSNIALPASPIALTVPGGANATTYNGTLNVINSVTGCSSSGSTIAVTLSKTNLTVTANNDSRIYGASNPIFTANFTGFVNGEVLGTSDVTGTPSLTSVATPASAVGTYPIVSAIGTLASGNYNFVFVNGTLTVSALSQSTADFRSNGSGNFSSAATWQFDQGGNDWVAATQAPGAGNNVLIRNGDNITLDVNYTVNASKAFDLSATSSLTINPTATLTIAGAANFAAQLVTIKSTAAGTGAIGQITGTLAGATNVTIERFIPNSGSRAWRLLSVPTKGTQTVRQAWQDLANGDAALTNNTPGIGTQITAPGVNATVVAAGFDNNSPAASMLTYSPSTNLWTGLSTTNTALENKDGYFLFVRGAREQGVSGNNSQTSATTLRSNGEIYTGTQTSNSIPDTKFGLVGNLYPSRIDFTQLSRTNVGNTFYLWDAKKVVGNKLGAYITFSGTNSFRPSLLGGSFNDANLSHTTIESGQSFFVVAAGGTGTVGFSEAAKTSATPSNGSFTNAFRPATPASNLVSFSTSLYFGNTIADANDVVFDNQYSNAIDANDALKMANPGENLAIWRHNQNLVVEGRQAIVEKDTIAFRMWNLSQQTYQLKFYPSNLSLPGLTAVLQDAFTNTNTVLNLSTTNTYNFVVNSNSASSNPTRFRVVFVKAASAPLPVTFIDIAANRQGATTVVKWTVAAERGVARYEVERSADGRNFSLNGTVVATAATVGEKLYSYADNRLLAGTAFYRVKSIDVDGSSKYSAIVKVSADGKAGYSVLGNPTNGNNIAVQFSEVPQGKYTLRLSNTSGQLLLSKVVNHAGGAATYSISAGKLANAVYSLQILEPSGKAQTLPVWITNAE
jgi:hypothetical protein